MNLPSLGFFPLLAVMAFIAVVLLVEGLYLLWDSYRGPEAKKIEQRLRALSGLTGANAPSAVMRNRRLSKSPAIERILLAIPRIGRLDHLLLQAGLEMSPAKLIGWCLACGGLMLVVLSFSNPLPSVRMAGAFTALFVPIVVVRWMKGRRLRRIEQQLPDTLDLISRALRAGHALPAGLQMAGQEMPEPIAAEFRMTNDEINFGESMQQALVNLGDRVTLTDMRYFVVAVLVQREAGGNLTEVLVSLSQLIRNRLKFHSRIKVLTTEGRMSAWVLAMLPFFIAGVLNVANPEFVRVLWTDPVGIMITNIVLGSMAVGAFWLYRLVKIKV